VIILKLLKDVAADIKEDLVFAEHVEKTWEEYDGGKFVRASKDDFLKQLNAY